MKGLQAAPAAAPKHEPDVTYDAEDVVITQNTATPQSLHSVWCNTHRVSRM